MPAPKSRPERKQSATKAATTTKAKPAPAPDKKPKPKKSRRKFNRRSTERSASVMVALDNAKGLRWVMEFAPIYAAILHGIEMGLSERRHQMQVCSIRSHDEFESLIQGRPPDGLLFLASKSVLTLKSTIGAIPCVSVLGNSCEGQFDQVTYNNHSTGRLPAELFLRHGFKTAAILGPIETGRSSTFGLRYNSFRETMEDAGATAISLLSNELYEEGNPSNQPRPEAISQLIHTLKTTHPLPRGLFVMADNLLPAVYTQLAAAGITPGTDLHVVSCNSDSPFFSSLSPEPARVDIPAEEIGRRAVEILDWRTQHPGRQTSTTVLAPSLHIPTGCSFGS